jgi:hypothetical protein
VCHGKLYFKKKKLTLFKRAHCRSLLKHLFSVASGAAWGALTVIMLVASDSRFNYDACQPVTPCRCPPFPTIAVDLPSTTKSPPLTAPVSPLIPSIANAIDNDTETEQLPFYYEDDSSSHDEIGGGDSSGLNRQRRGYLIKIFHIF